MSETVSTCVVVYDERVLDHRPPGWDPAAPNPLSDGIQELLARTGAAGKRWIHPERPERVSEVAGLLRAEPVPGVAWHAAAPAPHEALARVHDPAYLAYLNSLDGRTALLNADTTAVSPGSVEAARVAAGAAMTAVDLVCGGGAAGAFALVRPPGHHATRDVASGFCLLNNVAVAAAHARAAHGCERVLVVDWDVHHGNGTQQIFQSEPNVMFFDTHRAAPFYPGTGDLEDTGDGPGAGTIVNVPLGDDVGDAGMLAAFDEILAPAAADFDPDLVLVSAGFDAHADDLAMHLTEAGFAALCGRVRDIAARHAGGRLAMVMEGGYNTSALARSARACIEVLAGGVAPAPPPVAGPLPEALERAIRFHRR